LMLLKMLRYFSPNGTLRLLALYTWTMTSTTQYHFVVHHSRERVGLTVAVSVAISENIKGLVHPKMKIMSFITHPHAVPHP
ncbi:hypothetical protein, partial [Neoroseomonas marina]|uniref:hypothetical protein n=1 Tax=Neoroseomonas marina TaxID=1232220 RepID=UPI001B7D4E04